MNNSMFASEDDNYIINILIKNKFKSSILLYNELNVHKVLIF